MAEASFWRSLRKRIPGHVIRIENGCCPGTPDLNICQSGREFWVELKDVDEFPKRATTRVFGDEGLRADQVLWIRERVRNLGEVYILGKVADVIYCIEGKHAEGFNSFNRHELEERNIDFREVLGLVLRPTTPSQADPV